MQCALLLDRVEDVVSQVHNSFAEAIKDQTKAALHQHVLLSLDKAVTSEQERQLEGAKLIAFGRDLAGTLRDLLIQDVDFSRSVRNMETKLRVRGKEIPSRKLLNMLGHFVVRDPNNQDQLLQTEWGT